MDVHGISINIFEGGIRGALDRGPRMWGVGVVGGAAPLDARPTAGRPMHLVYIYIYIYIYGHPPTPAYLLHVFSLALALDLSPSISSPARSFCIRNLIEKSCKSVGSLPARFPLFFN